MLLTPIGFIVKKININVQFCEFDGCFALLPSSDVGIK